ncbi:MAG TPA: DUF2442 domain-containing protein [Stellaceae bacterium]|nr:DUF2442 domain-containing protein [Stellaceae bacterium]
MSKSKLPRTNTLISPVSASFGEKKMSVELSDGRTISVPLAWFPRLQDATLAQLENYELSPCGLHWDELDEDISVEGLLAGRGDETKLGKARRYLQV